MIFSLTDRKYTLQGIKRYKKLIFQKFRVGLFYYVADDMKTSPMLSRENLKRGIQ